jgi:hypothetical protein
MRYLFEVLAERIHERRVEEIYVSGSRLEDISTSSDLMKKYALSPVSVYITNPMGLEDFKRALKSFVKTKSGLKRVDIKPENKIHGAHSTVIGGREGREFLKVIAKCEYVKKIVPGVIEAKGSALGGGVRFKVTRCDDRGNVRGLLINGASVQEIHIVTTAKNREEGEVVLKILRSIISSV